MSDPIDRDDFNPNTYRPGNPARLARIETLGNQYQAALAEAQRIRGRLDDHIVKAKQTGHSYSQIAAAASMSIAGVQKILARKGYTP